VDLCNIFRCKVADVSEDTVTIEVSGKVSKITAMQSLLEPYGILEVGAVQVESPRRIVKKVLQKSNLTEWMPPYNPTHTYASTSPSRSPPHPVDPQHETTRFQPLSLRNENLVSNFAFSNWVNLYRCLEVARSGRVALPRDSGVDSKLLAAIEDEGDLEFA
jgi:hypothetical protein